MSIWGGRSPWPSLAPDLVRYVRSRDSAAKMIFRMRLTVKRNQDKSVIKCRAKKKSAACHLCHACHRFVTPGLVVKAASPVETRRNRWAGDTSLVGAGVGSNPTRNKIFRTHLDLA